MAQLAVRALRSVFDLGQQRRLYPDGLGLRNLRCIGLEFLNHRLQLFFEVGNLLTNSSPSRRPRYNPSKRRFFQSVSDNR
jgi:hypothetical protein